MDLFDKYNHPVPRYTSYPTVPHWQTEPPTEQEWIASIGKRLRKSPELSLYVHLPFCEELCTYCGCNKRITKNHGVEVPYVDTVLAEWKIYERSMLIKPLLKELHLGGGTPTFFSPTELKRLVQGILKRVDLADGAEMSFEAHPNSTTKAHLEVLAELGFNRLSIGVQDFNPHIMRLINRRQTEEDIQRTVIEAQAIGYRSINFDIIYGLPDQSVADIEYSVAKIAELRPERIAFYGYAHVPWVSPGQRAYSKANLPQGRDKWKLYETGKKGLEAMGYRDIGLDHFALPEDDLYLASREQRLHRNFMGYTTNTSKLSIGLGCSAISDSWNMYVQNEKKVEDYQRIVMEESRLPLLKGHRLKRDEEIVRRHISNLMCLQTTVWAGEEMHCQSLPFALENWADMEKDGLVKRGANSLSVTPLGKTFLRNVCVPLDSHMQRMNAGRPTFSRAV
ncbi:oxygen-independent coproporphyrinogen III oxidase [Lewinellaceae bacterium SD302]|nr:oxygen-independent coproporphyrinogen III oxidase [Lewinellaceae bacterium SD302]